MIMFFFSPPPFYHNIFPSFLLEREKSLALGPFDSKRVGHFYPGGPASQGSFLFLIAKSSPEPHYHDKISSITAMTMIIILIFPPIFYVPGVPTGVPTARLDKQTRGTHAISSIWPVAYPCAGSGVVDAGE